MMHLAVRQIQKYDSLVSGTIAVNVKDTTEDSLSCPSTGYDMHYAAWQIQTSTTRRVRALLLSMRRTSRRILSHALLQAMMMHFVVLLLPM